jgi:hypothetical protein
MAYKEILQIVPQLSSSDLNRIERSLSTRFGNIAKKFGSGLKAAITGGGITALALGVIDKILNPLKETQDAIDKILGQANDLSEMAKEFNTSSGKLFKLQKLGEAKGLDSGTLNMLMEKFQVAVAEAIHDPAKDTSVRQFAVPGQDMADMFLNFVQSLQKMKNKSDKLLVEQEVFGEKQILKSAEFLNADFPELMKKLGLGSGDAYTGKIDKGSKLKDEAQLLEAKRNADDMMNKLGRVNEGMVLGQNANETAKLARETKKFDSFKTMNNIDMKMDGLKDELSQMLLALGSSVNGITELTKEVKKLTVSKFIRGVWNSFGKTGK